MPKSLAASKKLMQTYLSELLTEDVEGKSGVQSPQLKEKQVQPVEQLLHNVSLPKVATNEAPKRLITAKAEQRAAVVEKAKSTVEEKFASEEITTQKSTGSIETTKERCYRQGDFQAMFFDVAGLMVAVPLIELGGIHNSDKTTTLMGKPDWFKGVMLHRDEKVNVVDTARWVMPEKCDEALISSLNYQYIIMLNNSQWGLTAERLVDTVTLKQEDVKWLDAPNKRPWLAGLVKDRMCALLDVDSLIKLLEKGANITEE